MPNEHVAGWNPKPGEVIVDTENHDVVRVGEDGEDEVIGRTRTTPTKHNGKQGKR